VLDGKLLCFVTNIKLNMSVVHKLNVHKSISSKKFFVVLLNTHKLFRTTFRDEDTGAFCYRVQKWTNYFLLVLMFARSKTVLKLSKMRQ
jgi:hypothetical protein